MPLLLLLGWMSLPGDNSEPPRLQGALRIILPSPLAQASLGHPALPVLSGNQLEGTARPPQAEDPEAGSAPSACVALARVRQGATGRAKHSAHRLCVVRAGCQGARGASLCPLPPSEVVTQRASLVQGLSSAEVWGCETGQFLGVSVSNIPPLPTPLIRAPEAL